MPPEARQPSARPPSARSQTAIGLTAKSRTAIGLIAKSQTAISLIAKARQPTPKPDSQHRSRTAISRTAKSPGCRNIPGFRSYLKPDAQQSASGDVS